MTNGSNDSDDSGIANPPAGGEHNFGFSPIRSYRAAWQAVARGAFRPMRELVRGPMSPLDHALKR